MSNQNPNLGQEINRAVKKLLSSQEFEDLQRSAEI
jgi:hypothetical protein